MCGRINNLLENHLPPRTDLSSIKLELRVEISHENTHCYIQDDNEWVVKSTRN